MRNSPCCQCDVCRERRHAGRQPYHMNKFDDTYDWNFRAQTRVKKRPTTFQFPAARPGCDCMCDRCVERRNMGKNPIHLKKYDDTAKTWHGTELGIDTRPCYCLDTPYVAESDSEELSSQHKLAYDGIALPGAWGVVCYKCSTLPALKHLVLQKGLKDPFPPGLTFRCFYVAVLEAADEAFRFRFLDLPAELRNAVYDELFLPVCYGSTSRYDVHPQILATCQQVRNEASKILYAEHSLYCGLRVQYYGTWHAENGDYVPQVTLDSEWSGPMYRDDAMQACELPPGSKYHRIGTLDLNITIKFGIDPYEEVPYSKSCAVVQNLLLTFVSSLMGGHELEKIVIYFDFDDSGPMGMNTHMIKWTTVALYPLRRLRGIKQVDVEIIGAPEDLAQSIASDMRSDTPAFNTLHELRRVEALLAPYLELVCTYQLEAFAGKSDSLDELLLIAAMPPVYLAQTEPTLMNEAHEMGVRSGIAEVQKLLDRLGPVELLLSHFIEEDK